MTETVTALVSLQQYQQDRAHLFRSIESMRWYVREHRAELVEAGAMLMGAGGWLVSPAEFDAFFLEQAKRKAQAKRPGGSR